jgi:CelD/BcsL family acetyltransferase involved in cellulose biosynthesis
VITTEVRATLGGVGDAWDELVEVAPLPSPFLRSWWLDGVAGPNARFVLVRDDTELIGGMALEEHRSLGIARLRPIGMELGADQLDLVAASGREKEVEEALRTWLRGCRARVVDLVGCSDRNRFVDILPEPRVEVVEIAPWTPLPSSFSEYLAERPGKLRSQIDRPERRLRREGASYRVVEPAQADRALADLRRLHAQVFGAESQFLPVFDRFARAAPAGLARGELVMHEFAVDGGTVAVSVCFEVANRLSYYQVGRDADRRWRGSGTALIAHSVEHAIESGCRELDLLRGTAAYKWEWGTNQREILRIRAGRGRAGQVCLAGLGLASRSKQAITAAMRTARRGRATETGDDQGSPGSGGPAGAR